MVWNEIDYRSAERKETDEEKVLSKRQVRNILGTQHDEDLDQVGEKYVATTLLATQTQRSDVNLQECEIELEDLQKKHVMLRQQGRKTTMSVCNLCCATYCGWEAFTDSGGCDP